MLAGLTSRWTMPAAHSASSPAATSVQTLHRGRHVERAVALELVVERHALDEPLGHVRQAFVLAGVEHRHHVRVLDRLRDPRLAVEAAPERLVAGVVVLDQLERNSAAVGAGRRVDLAHPAFPEHGVHVVLADLAADSGVAHAHRSLMVCLGSVRVGLGELRCPTADEPSVGAGAPDAALAHPDIQALRSDGLRIWDRMAQIKRRRPFLGSGGARLGWQAGRPPTPAVGSPRPSRAFRG